MCTLIRWQFHGLSTPGSGHGIIVCIVMIQNIVVIKIQITPWLHDIPIHCDLVVLLLIVFASQLPKRE